jgi:uncharacterized coiled-coil DUF342 family protein
MASKSKIYSLIGKIAEALDELDAELQEVFDEICDLKKEGRDLADEVKTLVAKRSHDGRTKKESD